VSTRVVWTQIERKPVRARVTTPAPACERPVVVALPGLGLTGDYLLPLARALAPSLRTYVVDLPGSGGAPGPRRRLRAAQLAQVVELWLLGERPLRRRALRQLLRLRDRLRGR
jgi:pimeloyl-ACP methyl ester carboxylesterase